MDKKIAMAVIALIVGGGLGFFGGMKYQQNKTAKMFSSRSGQFGGAGGLSAGRQGARGSVAGMGFLNGQVISKDEKSLTIRLMNGGSQIVLLSPSTQYRKAVDGTDADIAVDSQVTVTGSSNSDGSLTAQSIQIRQASSTPSSIGR